MASAISPEELVARIQLVVRQRRIRLSEFFLNFDRLGKKFCTAAQFRRALDMSGVVGGLEDVRGPGLGGRDHVEAALAELIDAYADPAHPGMVRYANFCAVVDEVFALRNLQKTPLRNVTLALADEPPLSSKLGLNHPDLNDARLSSLRRKLLDLGRAVAASGCVVKDFFKDFDHNNDGCITRVEFMRGMHRLHKEMNHDHAAELMEAYAVTQGVHFRALQCDIEFLGAGHDASFAIGSPSKVQQLEGLIGLEGADASGALRAAKHEARFWADPVRADAALGDLERRIALEVARRRLRLAEFFEDADPLRRGTIADATFVQALRRTVATRLDERAGAAVAAKYAAGPGVVDWRAFVRAVALLGEDVAGANLAATSTHRFTPRAVPGAGSVLATIRAKVAARRVVLVPTFQDFDPRRNGHVTNDQYERVLGQFGLLPEARPELDLLLDAYAAQDGRHPADRYVNYRAFLADLQDDRDASDDETLPPLPPSPTLSPSGGDARSPRPAPVVVQHVRQIVLARRVRLREFFQDDDTLRRGVVTRSQFFRGLRAAVGGIVGADECENLADAYEADAKGRDAQGNPFVRWVAFVADVDRVFAPQGLEKRPAADCKAEVFAARAGVDLGYEAEALASAYEARGGVLPAAKGAVARLARLVEERNLELQSFFKDFDAANRGTVRETHFKRVLSMVGLFQELTDDEVRALCESCVEPAPFDGETIKKDSRAGREEMRLVEINYDKFLALVGVRASHGKAGLAASSLEALAPAPSGKRLKPPQIIADVDVHEVLADLREQLARKRARVRDFLADGDRLRSGETTAARFRSALGRAGLALTEGTLRALCEAFRSPKNRDMISWRLFLDALWTGESEYSSIEVPAVSTELSPVELRALGETMKRLKTLVDQRRLHLKPSFQDYDKHNRCSCSKEQLAAVADKMQLKTSSNEVDLLFKAFKVPEGLHPVGKDFFDYGRFLGAVANAA